MQNHVYLLLQVSNVFFDLSFDTKCLFLSINSSTTNLYCLIISKIISLLTNLYKAITLHLLTVYIYKMFVLSLVLAAFSSKDASCGKNCPVIYVMLCQFVYSDLNKKSIS
jgi:hypothetical protein